jgi:thiosulfate/3-mercaptopyruvate sulfurtransferase
MGLEHRSPHRGRADFQDQAGFSRLLSEAGVGPDTTVVLYGGNNNWFAAYAYWLLKLRGFDDVKLVNGGRKKWELESRELVQDRPASRPQGSRSAGLSVRAAGAPRRGDRQGGRGGLRRRPLARGVPGREAGARPPAAGAVAGARPHRRRREHPLGEGRQRRRDVQDADELKELYADEGITGDGEIIAYCRIGERSSHTWFALQELLGYENVKNYDGSWTEYGSLVGAPVEIGG